MGQSNRQIFSAGKNKLMAGDVKQNPKRISHHVLRPQRGQRRFGNQPPVTEKSFG